LLPHYLAGARFADYDAWYLLNKKENMTHLSPETEPRILELYTHEDSAITIFDLPASKLPVVEKIVAGLKERAFMIHLLQGDNRPEGMSIPYGIWPRPDNDALKMITEVAGMPALTSEEITMLGRSALTIAA
jgi:hypothetical protein